MKYFLSILFFALNLFSYEETIKKDIPLKDIENIIVENVNGNIEISGSERDSVLIEAVKKAEKEAHLRNLKVKIEKTGKELKIQTEHTRSYFLGFLPVKMGGSANYKIKVPKNLKLKINTVNGDIFIENQDSHIEAESVNGNINLKDISGNGNFETVNGEIKIEIKNDIPNFRAESVNGDIYLKSAKKINARYFLEVVNGKIRIIPQVLEIKSSSPKEMQGVMGDGRGKIHMETVNGSITIETREDFTL